MDLRRMTAADRPGMVALWRQVFGDEAAYINRCIDGFVGARNVFVAMAGADVIAILSAAPCTLGGRQGAYLYALATAPARRATGVMSTLMAYAEGELAAAGATYAALIPANPPLFGYYRKRGYTVEVRLRFVELDKEGPEGWQKAAQNTGKTPCRTTPMPKRLGALRARWLHLEEHITFETAQMAVVCEDMAASGLWLLEGEAGYAVCQKAGRVLLIPELGAAGDAAALGLCAEGLAQAGCDKAVVSLPAASSLLAGQGNVRPVALLKPLAGQVGPKAPYLRFALDEVADSFLWE